jgi:hypothetical protein
MTWIVGTAPPFGSAILVSDICVTFTGHDGSLDYRDCLQKIYLLGPFVLGGFAGSVKIGFALLARLQHEFTKVPQGHAWNVDVIAHTWWPRLSRRIFASAPEGERALGAAVILASVHPHRNRGDAPWPWTDIHTFKSPNFGPNKAEPFEAVAIGKGEAVSSWMEEIQRFCSDLNFMQFAVDGEGVQAGVLAHHISSLSAESPTSGISSLFQIGIVTRGGYIIHDHEHTILESDGRQIEFKFPSIAKGYKEFRELCQQFNRQVEEAIC